VGCRDIFIAVKKMLAYDQISRYCFSLSVELAVKKTLSTLVQLGKYLFFVRELPVKIVDVFTANSTESKKQCREI
jgi:hypothetical protein